MKLIISNVSGIPIYEQIKQQVKAAIRDGYITGEGRSVSPSTRVNGILRLRVRTGP